MIIFSLQHDSYYDRIAWELLQYGDLGSADADLMRGIRVRGACSDETQAAHVDRLYQTYGNRQVLE